MSRDPFSGFSARRATRSAPHYEVWYGKVDVEPGVAFWFRYTTLDGATQEASTWAILFHDDGIDAGRSYFGLEDLAEPNTVVGLGDEARLDERQVFHVSDDIHLDERNAVGRAHDVTWDLRWENGGREFRYLPHLLFELGLAGSTYDGCFLDLRVSGEVKGRERRYQFEARPGMLGHIQGRKVIANRWAWAHCNSFAEDDDAVFEGLSPELLLAGRTVGPLSAFVLYCDGRRYAFDTPLSLVRAETTYGRHRWQFDVTARGARLRGEAVAPGPSKVAVVEYTDTDDSRLWCHNSKLADLTLHLTDTRRGLTRELTAAGTSAFEFVTRERPDVDITI